jgi:hypothetical protein
LDKVRRAQIIASWRKRGEWNRSLGRNMNKIREMISLGWQMSVSLSRLLHASCGRRGASVGVYSDLGYEHCWMCRWARRRSKNVAVQKTVWQVVINERTAAQLLRIASE